MRRRLVSGLLFVTMVAALLIGCGKNTNTSTNDKAADTAKDKDLIVVGYSQIGAEMQKYLAGQCTREELATAIENYWKAQA